MSGEKPVKVVYIKTQYVKTDPLSFKSVVQNLTGKNSTTDSRPVKVKREIMHNNCCWEQQNLNVGGDYSFLTRDLSSKDLERLSKELPSLDELHKLLAFD